ncbi:hypothetical protein [Methylorubrum podarium]|uniref:hypothetical protein n=1 Tax=Methylorubrum podarium TaxID=200476 RepID=UPI001EE27955|nr:hypothetical protein [Methylorubrum podarium]GJE72819.1 hypothetical protein CHKEEEPN_4380 [Methylorubrum podarium]
MSALSFSQRCDQAMRCEAMFAGAEWAAEASFPTLVTLANLDVEAIADRPGDLRDAAWALTDPQCLSGDAWAETHLGTPDPSPTWIRYWIAGAMEEFRLSFEKGRAGAPREVTA